MKKNRRDFLKIAGVSTLGFSMAPMTKAFAKVPGSTMSTKPEARTANRWAMIIDLKKLKSSGPQAVKTIVDACHHEHNVPKFDNTKDEIKWIWTEEFNHAFPHKEGEHHHEWEKETMNGVGVPVLCNHCENPACVRVCPTKATFQREDGIVLMDFHRCIGCRYCMAACPFGARSFNWRDPRPFVEEPVNKAFPTRSRGVVEKCNFCAERLAKGQNPACVDACKNGEIVFGDLEDPNSEVREVLKKNFAIRRKPHLGTHPQVYYIV